MAIATRPPDLRNTVDIVVKAFSPFRDMVDVVVEWAERPRELADKFRKLANELETAVGALEAYSSYGRIAAPASSGSSDGAAPGARRDPLEIRRRQLATEINAALTNRQRQQALKNDAERYGAVFALEGTSLKVDSTLVPLSPTLADLVYACLIDEKSDGDNDGQPFVRAKTLDEIRCHLKKSWEARSPRRAPKQFNDHCLNALFSRLRLLFRKHRVNEYLIQRKGDHVRLLHRRAPKISRALSLYGHAFDEA